MLPVLLARKLLQCTYSYYHLHRVAVSEFVSGGELLELCQSYGMLPEELVQIYVAEISLALGKLFWLM
jgi:serine/threonine protein kinase